MPPYVYGPKPSLYICMSPCIFPKCHGTLGASVHPICLRVFGRASVHLSCISVSISASIVLQFIMVIPVAPHHCGLLLYWPGCLWSLLWFMLLFLFHYVSSFYHHGYDYYYPSGSCVVQYVISSFHSYHGPFLDGLTVTSGQCNVDLPSLLAPRHSGDVFGPAIVPQQQSPSQMPLQAYATYDMGPLQVGFSLRV